MFRSISSAVTSAVTTLAERVSNAIPEFTGQYYLNQFSANY
jgi:chromosome condensin MukBEF complex kleisin-like MukF subunit